MKTYKLNEIENKRILGRNVKDAGKTDKPLALFWGASALEFTVRASEVWVCFSSEFQTSEPWVAIEVNGAPVSRFMVLKDKNWICIARGMNPEKDNLISIIKDTQPMSGEEMHSLFIHEIGLNDSGTFVETVPRKLMLEFVGDSITSGEGLAGMPEEGDWIPQWFCSSKTYAVKTAKKLNADWKTISQSGWGICWGWDGNLNSAIPPHYTKVCSVMKGDYQKSLGAQDDYDFGNGSDFVIINLGTNDNEAFNQPAWKDENGVEHPLKKNGEIASEEDGLKIVNGMIEFLKVIRKCNPSAKIIWVWGMMRLTILPDYFMTGISEYKKLTGDNNVYSFVLDAMSDIEVCEDDKGSRGHPGIKTHKSAADKIADFITKLM